MDRVRFGRALGYGARHAVKAAMGAAQAAAAEPSPRQQAGSSRDPAPVAATRGSTQTAPPVRKVAQAAARQSGSFLSPLKRAWGSVLLEVTGTFFALFALFMAQGVWRLKANFTGPQNTPEAHRLWVQTGLLLLFAYFAISSFVKARRNSRVNG